MKMNKIFKLTAVALCGVVALTGCIRETLPQTGTVTQGQVQDSSAGIDASLKGLPSGLMSAAYGMWSHGDFGYTSFGVWNDHANHLIMPCTVWSGGNQYYDRFQQPYYGLGMGASGYMAYHYWGQNYPNIKLCNDMIATCGDDETLATYRGIAKTFRALLYIDMARMFDALPANAPDNANYAAELLEVEGLTVPIVTEATTEQDAANNPRATREELFTFIFADLADAAASLAEYKPTSVNYPSLAAVYALYARAYLWLGGFEIGLYSEVPTGADAYRLAAEYARKAIDTAGGAIMTEAEWTNPRTAFNTVASSWIWSLQMSTDTVLGNLHAFAAHMCPEATYGYTPLAQPGVTKMMYDRMSRTDWRRSVILSPEPSYEDIKGRTLYTEEEFNAAGFNPYVSFKFRPAGGEMVDFMTANAITFPIVRLEEMYFIEMEATAHYDVATANTLLYTFMYNRDPYYTYAGNQSDVDALVDEIIFQKQVEFWGEGHTLFDMKRLNMSVDTSDPNTYPVAGANFEPIGRLPWWNACIPMGEMQVNLGIQKNNPDPSGALKSSTAMPE